MTTWPMVEIAKGEYDRRKFIGSSNAAAIMGLGEYGQTPYTVYLAKTADTVEEMDPERRKFLERRKRWEPVVVKMLEEELDAEIVATNRQYQDPEVPYFSAEIDFEWVDENGVVQNGEIKTVSPFSYGEKYGWGEPGSADIPIHYGVQVQFGLGVTGRSETIVAAMVGLDAMRFYHIKRDDVVIGAIRNRCMDFWQNNVLAGKVPEPQTVADVEKMFRTTDSQLAVIADHDHAQQALDLRALDAQIAALNAQRDALEFSVKNYMRDREELYVDGKKVVTWKEQSWSRLDLEALKVNEKAIYKRYTKSGKYRVFRTLRG